MRDEVDFSSIQSFLRSTCEIHKEAIAFSKFENGRFNTLTYDSLLGQSIELAGFLKDLEIENGDRVALLADSSPSWVVSAFGVFQSGATLVPIDPKLTGREIKRILNNVSAKYLIASQNYTEAYEELLSELTSFRKIISLENWRESRIPQLEKFSNHSLSEIAAPNPALICYTSGTSGRSKGVFISQEAILMQAKGLKVFQTGTMRQRVFSILPLNHLFGFTCSVMGSLAIGAEVCYAHDISADAIQLCMKERRIHQFIAVPLFLESLRNGIIQKVKTGPLLTQIIFGWAIRLAPIIPKFIKKKIFSDFHSKMGGHLNWFMSGGAPLNTKVEHFFRALGLRIYQGYGLTETGPIITINSPGEVKIGSVGKAMTGVEVKIEKENSSDSDGEIKTKGQHVMLAYYSKGSIDTSAISEDGWFSTGDIGHIDKSGWLFITGRKKSMIVLPSGKKVYPEEIQAIYNQSPLVKDSCIVGIKHGRKKAEKIIAVIQPSDEMLENNPNATDSELKSLLDIEIRVLNQSLASFKHPSLTIVKREDFEKTSTMKIRRALIENEVKAFLENIKASDS